MKTLLVFGENRAGDRLDDAPSMNDVYGTDLPEMLSSRAFGIHKKAADDHPDRMDKLMSTFKATFEDPALLELGAKYKSLLTGA